MVRILCVDDDSIDFELLEKKINSINKDLHFTFADSGEEALELYKAENYQCVLSDYQMPGMDGLELLKAIREQNDNIPFIFLTGQGNEKLAVEALRAGASDYYSKEVGIAHYNRLINSILKHVEAARQKEEKHLAEQELASTRGILRAAFAQSPAGILIADAPDINIWMANPAAMDLRGHVDKPIDKINVEEHATSWQAFRPDGTPYPEEELPLSRAVLHGEVTKGEELIIRYEGNDDRWISANAAPIFNSAGERTAGIVIFVDITRQKKAEVELRKNNLKYLLEESPDPVFSLSHDGTYLFANKAFALGTKKHLHEIVGKKIWDIFSEEEAAKRFAVLSEVFKSGIEKKIEVKVPLPDADSFYLTTVTPVKDKDGQVHTAICSSKNITERKVAEDKLRNERNLIESIIHSMPGLFYMFDVNLSNFLRRNSNWSNVSGYSEEELDSIPIQNLIEKKKLFEDRMQESSPSNFSPMETQLLTKSGEKIPYLFTGEKLVVGNAIYLVGQGIDISELKHARKELELAYTDLRQANKELDSFSYTVAHDLKSPLRHIKSFADILKYKSEDELINEGPSMISKIIDSATRATLLVDDILRFSTTATGAIKPGKINLSKMAEDIVDNLEPKCEARDVKFKIAQDMIAVGDPGLVKVLLENLIGNAWKFTAKTEHASISVSSEKIDGINTFLVKDNGVGFDTKQASKLFSPFERLHSRKDFQGSGIGLATVQRIIDRHGGKIWFDSQPGKGSTFYFTLGKKVPQKG